MKTIRCSLEVRTGRGGDGAARRGSRESGRQKKDVPEGPERDIGIASRIHRPFLCLISRAAFVLMGKVRGRLAGIAG
ncbi:hypothetical protein GCM10027161_19520 [Microbispora hainanensis]